jgi:hypothetical protein
MIQYPFNEEKRLEKEHNFPKNSKIWKDTFEDSCYLIEIDYDLLPPELSDEQKDKIVESIYRVSVWKI